MCHIGQGCSACDSKRVTPSSYQAPAPEREIPILPSRIEFLRACTREIEEIANRLEDDDQFTQADRLRSIAAELRAESRTLRGWKPNPRFQTATDRCRPCDPDQQETDHQRVFGFTLGTNF